MRKKRSDIYKEVVDALSEPLNILQIKEKTGINWETVKNALETLETVGCVQKIDHKYAKKTFALRNDTLLGLPLTQEQEKKIRSIAKRICELWNDKLPHRRLNKTFLQKILVRTIQKTDLPYGWYLFGQCCILQVDPNIEAESVKDYDETINDVIDEYKRFDNTNELLYYNYQQEGNGQYLSRLSISNQLMNNFTEESINILKKEIKNIQFSIKSEDLIDCVNTFASIFFRLANKLNLRELEDIRPQIYDAFSAIWEMIATYNLYGSTKRFYGQSSEMHYKLRMESLDSMCLTYLSNLQDLLPAERIEDDLSRFKGILAGQSR